MRFVFARLAKALVFEQAALCGRMGTFGSIVYFEDRKQGFDVALDRMFG